MNRLNMNDADCSFDDLLCQSLSLFHQFRLYDDRMEEDNAFKFLREAEKVVADNKDGVCVAKLGCVIECLAHRFYINDNTDGILEEVDTFLIKFWKGIKQPSSEAFIASLWVGEYFLLRLKNPESRFRSRSKKMVSKILSFMADMLRKPEKQKALTLSSVVVLEETVDWIAERTVEMTVLIAFHAVLILVWMPVSSGDRNDTMAFHTVVTAVWIAVSTVEIAV